MENNVSSFIARKGTQLTLKLMLIGFLTLLLLIPQAIIQDLIFERQSLSKSVAQEVASGWGSEQLVTGPFMVIPYTKVDDDKKVTNQYLIIMAKTLDVSGDIATTTKHRSIYEVNLYQTALKMKGYFDIKAVLTDHSMPSTLALEKAFIAIGISDLKGIQSNVQCLWNNQSLSLKSGMNDISFDYNKIYNNNNAAAATEYPNKPDRNHIGMYTGLSAPITLINGNDKYDYEMTIDLKGSSSLEFAPIASNTTVQLQSTYKDPSFIGHFLPDNTVNAQGFKAVWKVSEYNRNIPDFTLNTYQININDSVFGVNLQSSVGNYSKISRAIKYMLLIIALTFMVVFLTEVVERKRIHIIQYTLTGLALAIFFTLLLAFSEVLSFDLSYVISALAIIAMLYLYSLTLFKNKKSSLLLLCLTTMLFGYIYSIIQLEKTALLTGAIGLFVILGMTMYATRKINWYEEEVNRDE